MKCLGRLESFALAAAFVVAGCSGGGGDSNGSVPKEEMPEVNPTSLLRNPQNPLTCDRPLAENPLSTPLVRLTHEEYVNSVRDLFEGLVDEGDLPKRQDFSDELKEGIFSNNVYSQLGSASDTQARESAAVAVSGEAIKDLPKLMGCEAKDKGAEGPCVQKFIEEFGLRAWRHPLTNEEKTALKELFDQARAELEFPQSVRTVVGAMLQSPQFLYRIWEGTGEEVDGVGKRLSDYEVASNLSYLIWDTTPNAAMLALAKKGELSTAAQIEAQARKMLEDPRARQTVRQFQREWLALERVEAQARAGVKDKKVFPKYGDAQAESSFKGLEAFLEDTFWEGDRSLKNFFTSSKGFVNDDTAEIYGVEKPGGSELVAVDLDPTKRKGFLTQPAVMAGWASGEAQSAILRGAFIMDKLLCAPSPPPPDDVKREFVAVPDRNAVTLRQVVEMTVEKGSCAGCHKIIDGFGFLYENYDGIGVHQTKERDLDIDASNEVIETFDLNGQYNNGVEFADVLGKSEQAAQCAVQHFYEYALARTPVAEDGCLIAPLTDSFLKSGMDMRQLVLDVVKSQAFRYRGVAQ